MKTTSSFANEKQLVKVARRLIRQALQEAGISATLRYEVNAPGGVPDLVLYSKSFDRLRYVVTVEFKLSNWRRGLQQSFKSRNYGNEAYLVLDRARVEAALANYNLFKKANVGLLSVSRDHSLQVWRYPRPQLPFSIEFSKAIAQSLLNSQRNNPKDLPFTRSIRGGVYLSKLRELWGTPLLDGAV